MGKQLMAALQQQGRAPDRCNACDQRARGLAWGNEPAFVAARAGLVRFVAQHARHSAAARVRLRAHHAVAAVPARRLARAWRGWGLLVRQTRIERDIAMRARLTRQMAARRRWRVLRLVLAWAFAWRRPPRLRQLPRQPAPAPASALNASARTFVPQERYEHALLLLWERQETAMREAVNWQLRALQAESQLAGGAGPPMAMPPQVHPDVAWPPLPSQDAHRC